LRPCERKELAEHLLKDERVSVHRACRVTGATRSMFYYRSQGDDTEVREKLGSLATSHPNRGFDCYYGRIRTEGLGWNRKRVLRVHRGMRLVMRRKHRRRLPERIREPLAQPVAVNFTWSMDFMHDALGNGRKVRVFNVLDDHSREAVAVRAERSFPAERVVEVLEQLSRDRGLPRRIRVDNGPEFISHVFTQWCAAKGVEIHHIQPGKPAQNACTERFNRTFREDVLDAYIFDDIEQLRLMAERWAYDYNHNHPHTALGGMAPVRYRLQGEKGRAPFPPAKTNLISNLALS
jgi:putative transposase